MSDIACLMRVHKAHRISDSVLDAALNSLWRPVPTPHKRPVPIPRKRPVPAPRQRPIPKPRLFFKRTPRVIGRTVGGAVQ